MDIPKTAQGNAKLITEDPDVTTPDLHRRIDNDRTPLQEGEVAPDTYILNVSGVDSYRYTKRTTHDGESTTSEVP